MRERVDTRSTKPKRGVSMATRYGTQHNDSISGTSSSDTLYGFDGNDTLRGLDGDDALYGGNGEDFLFGGSGNDRLEGGSGNDTMDGGAGNDTYYSGNLAGDTIVDASGLDTVVAPGGFMPSGIERMLLRTTLEVTQATGNSLGNLIHNQSGADAFIDGGGGNDTLIGGSGFDFFTISSGNDVVDGRGGIDWLSGGSVDFRAGTATGGSGTTRFSGIEAAEGSFGHDRLAADDNGRTLHGEGGNDTVLGGAGADTLFGDGGFDHPDTNPGDDVVRGGAGNDYLQGGNGSDRLDGGTGNDTLRGAGSFSDDPADGADTFVFSVAAGGANADWISVFESGSDEIAFENAVFTRLGGEGGWAAGDGRFYAAAGASAAHDASDRLVYDTQSGELYYDADGSGGAGALIVATLEGAPALAAGDITVI